MTATLILPAILDVQAAEPLRTQFLGMSGQNVIVDASNVDRLGALCLQVLIAAHKTWSRAGLTMTIDHSSPSFAQQWKAFGADVALNGPGEAA